LGILETNLRSVRIVCDCGGSFAASVVRVIDLSTDPELFSSLLRGEFNQVVCKHCQRSFPSETPVFVHDSQNQKYVCLYPSAWRSRELALRIEFYQELLGLGGDSIPGYVREAKFVFSPEACAGALGWQMPAEGEHSRTVETAPEEPESRLPLAQELEESDFEQVSDVDQVDRRDSSIVQRWRESGQDYYAFLDDGALHIFQRHRAPQRFGEKADIFFQLHRIENFPLIVLLLVAESPAGGDEVLYWLFNLDNRVDVSFVEQLAERFEINLHLFDEKYQRHRSLVYSPPLSHNVEYVLEEARKWFEQIDPKRRNFFIAASKFDETAYDVLGRKKPGLEGEAFKELPSPSLTKLALDILTYWSSRENYEYLIFIKSFPVDSFKSILKDVLERAIYFGLAMTEKMKRMAVELGLAGSKEELVKCLVANYAEVLIGMRENDLDPATLWENWQQLADDAEELGVEIDRELSELAQVARERLDERNQAIPLDLSDDVEMYGALDQLETPELVDLLRDPDNRADAARVLAESGKDEMFEEVVRAYRRMNRREVDKLGDSLAGFGEVARQFLTGMFREGKGAQAVGAMRALVRLDGAATAGELLRVVVEGRRGVWREAAELFGTSGASYAAVEQGTWHAEASVRNRMVYVLDALEDESSRARLKEMAEKDDDARVRRTAKKALQSKQAAPRGS